MFFQQAFFQALLLCQKHSKFTRHIQIQAEHFLHFVKKTQANVCQKLKQTELNSFLENFIILAKFTYF